MSRLQTLILVATIMGLSQAAMTPEQVSQDRSRSPRDRLLDRFGPDSLYTSSEKLQQRIDFLRGEAERCSLIIKYATINLDHWRSHYLQVYEELRDLLKLKIELQPEAELAELKRAAAAEMTCPDQHMDTYSHTLTPMTHYGFLHSRECDECGKEACRGDVLLHCATCDFHLCQACHEYKADPVRRELQAVETIIKQLQFSKGGRGRLGATEEAPDVESNIPSPSDDSIPSPPGADSPKSGVNPFDTPKSGVNPFDTLHFGVDF